MKTVPYQQCPVCYGKGVVFTMGVTNPTEICRVCSGKCIIPQFIYEELVQPSGVPKLGRNLMEPESVEERAYVQQPKEKTFTLNEVRTIWYDCRQDQFDHGGVMAQYKYPTFEDYKTRVLNNG